MSAWNASTATISSWQSFALHGFGGERGARRARVAIACRRRISAVTSLDSVIIAFLNRIILCLCLWLVAFGLSASNSMPWVVAAIETLPVPHARPAKFLNKNIILDFPLASADEKRTNHENKACNWNKNRT